MDGGRYVRRDVRARETVGRGVVAMTRPPADVIRRYTMHLVCRTTWCRECGTEWSIEVEETNGITDITHGSQECRDCGKDGREQ